MTRQVVVFAVLLCGLLGAGIGSLGCVAGEAPSTTPEPANAVYLVELTAATVSSLPKCTSALGGTVAFVDSPPSLWACENNQWTQITCTTSKSGSVAYASATQALFACVSKQWTRIALPEAGPPGPPGPRGPEGDAGAQSLVKLTPEPAGSNCAAGGERIDVGIDRDGDGVLQPSEITQTAYVCNGLAGGNADATVGSDAGDASDALDAADGFDGWDGGPNAIQQYAAQYANAFCSGQGKCCPGYDAGAFNQSACAQAWTTQGWEYTLPANAAVYAAGHLTLNATQGAACISALQNFACTTLGTVTAAQYSAVTNVCLGALTGTIAVGSGGCLSSFECANGYCNLPTDGGTGTCNALVGGGGTCSPGNDSPDQMCHQAGVFAPKLWCNRLAGGATGTCVPPLADGVTCYVPAVSATYFDDYGCTSLLCGDNSLCGSPATYPTPPPGFCENWPTDAGGGG